MSLFQKVPDDGSRMIKLDAQTVANIQMVSVVEGIDPGAAAKLVLELYVNELMSPTDPNMQAPND